MCAWLASATDYFVSLTKNDLEAKRKDSGASTMPLPKTNSIYDQEVAYKPTGRKKAQARKERRVSETSIEDQSTVFKQPNNNLNVSQVEPKFKRLTIDVPSDSSVISKPKSIATTAIGKTVVDTRNKQVVTQYTNIKQPLPVDSDVETDILDEDDQKANNKPDLRITDNGPMTMDELESSDNDAVDPPSPTEQIDDPLIDDQYDLDQNTTQSSSFIIEDQHQHAFVQFITELANSLNIGAEELFDFASIQDDFDNFSSLNQYDIFNGFQLALPALLFSMACIESTLSNAGYSTGGQLYFYINDQILRNIFVQVISETNVDITICSGKRYSTAWNRITRNQSICALQLAFCDRFPIAELRKTSELNYTFNYKTNPQPNYTLFARLMHLCCNKVYDGQFDPLVQSSITANSIWLSNTIQENIDIKQVVISQLKHPFGINFVAHFCRLITLDYAIQKTKHLNLYVSNQIYTQLLIAIQLSQQECQKIK